MTAGGFAVKGDIHGTGLENFTAWCVDIPTSIRLPSNYEITAVLFTGAILTAARLSNIERLFETGFRMLNLASHAQSAGFQRALWEVLYENAGSFNLTSGNFKAANSFNAITVGQALLAGMSGPVTQGYNQTFLQSNDSRATAAVTTVRTLSRSRRSRCRPPV